MTWLPLPRWALMSALAALVLAGMAAAWKFTQGDEILPQAPKTHELDRLHTACVEEMIRSTCKVMASPQAAPSASSVFVAGVGPVDAAYYRELRASGDAMCSVVRNACAADWNGPRCKTARGLYGSVAGVTP